MGIEKKIRGRERVGLCDEVLVNVETGCVLNHKISSIRL